MGLGSAEALRALHIVRERKNKIAYELFKKHQSAKNLILRTGIEITKDEPLPHIRVQPIVGRLQADIYCPEEWLQKIRSVYKYGGERWVVAVKLPYLIIREGRVVGIKEKEQQVWVDEVNFHELVHLMWGHDTLGPLLRSVSFPKLLEIAVEYQTHCTVWLFAGHKRFQRLFFSQSDIEFEQNGYVQFVRRYVSDPVFLDMDRLGSWSVLDLYEELERNVLKSLTEQLEYMHASDGSEQSDIHQRQEEESDVLIPLVSSWRIGVEKSATTEDDVVLDLDSRIFVSRAGSEDKKGIYPGKMRGVDARELIDELLESEDDEEYTIPWYVQVVHRIKQMSDKVNWLEPDPTTLWDHDIYIPTWERQLVDVMVVVDTSGSMEQEELIQGLKFLTAVADMRIVGIYLHTTDCYYRQYDPDGIDLDDAVEAIRANMKWGGTDYDEAYRTVIEDGRGHEVVLHITDGMCNSSIPEALHDRLLFVFTESPNFYLQKSDFHKLTQIGAVEYIILESN